MKKTRLAFLIIIPILFLGFRKDPLQKYYMIVKYDNNNLSAKWFQKSYFDTVSADSGCISNRKLNLDFFDNNLSQTQPSQYYVMIFNYKNGGNLECLGKCPPERQVTEFSQNVLKVFKEYSQYIDTNLINEQKNIPYLDSSSNLYFSRNHLNNTKKDNFYRIFEITAHKKIIRIGYEWKKYYLFNAIDDISIHCSKKSTRNGDTAVVEIYSKVKIIKEIKCK